MDKLGLSNPASGDAVMSQAPPTTRRRWFQFGLGNLFWLMIVVALVLFLANERKGRMRERAESEAKLHETVKQAHKRELELISDHRAQITDIQFRHREQLSEATK